MTNIEVFAFLSVLIALVGLVFTGLGLIITLIQALTRSKQTSPPPAIHYHYPPKKED